MGSTSSKQELKEEIQQRLEDELEKEIKKEFKNIILPEQEKNKLFEEALKAGKEDLKKNVQNIL
tara:strand:- start:3273 stop:3464 length:192 start_codon:yes stop_codon:yes gene_type:complete